jgi:hypothetical protein
LSRIRGILSLARSWESEFVVASKKTPSSSEYIEVDRLFQEAKEAYIKISCEAEANQKDLSFAYGKYHGLAMARQAFWGYDD